MFYNKTLCRNGLYTMIYADGREKICTKSTKNICIFEKISTFVVANKTSLWTQKSF